MNFETFTRKNKIILTKDEKLICEHGLDLMKNAKDPHHSINHIRRLFGLLDEFLVKTKANTKDFDLSLIIMLIIWHDVWLASQQQAINFHRFLINEIYHPVGASKMLVKFAKRKGVYTKQVRNLSKIIKYNESALAAFYLLRPLEKLFYRVSIEGKIVRDLDLLDAWEKERFDELFDHYVLKNKFNMKYLVIGKFWYYVFLRNAKPNMLYFKWSKKKFTKMKKILLETIQFHWDNRRDYGIS